MNERDGNELGVSFKFECGTLFELNSAVVLPGQFAGTFAGMYIYAVTCLCFVILLTWKHLSVLVLNQHRDKRVVTNCATIEAKLG